MGTEEGGLHRGVWDWEGDRYHGHHRGRRGGRMISKAQIGL